jgi:hypothetical protein
MPRASGEVMGMKSKSSDIKSKSSKARWFEIHIQMARIVCVRPLNAFNFLYSKYDFNGN